MRISDWSSDVCASDLSAALGIFGTSNVGAAVTALLAPLVMAAMGWQTVVHVWAAALLILAILFLITTRDDPETAARRRDARKPVALRQQLEALRNLQVWRLDRKSTRLNSSH